MLITDLKYVDESFSLKKGSLLIRNGKLACTADRAVQNENEETVSMSGLTALPGFIDIHTHGANGADTCDKSEASLKTLSDFYARHGVTSFCPTTMTLGYDELEKIFRTVEQYKGNESGAYIHGINMEGPFVSKEKCGAQNTDFIKAPDINEFRKLSKISKISLVDVAPETDGAYEFAAEASKTTVCSVAHTDATYEQTAKAFDCGFSHVTHLFNAMTPFTHRTPGVVGAVFENNGVTAELICDGFHLAPAAVRLAFKILGDERCVVISDSLSSAGCKDGEYMLGGQKVLVRNGKAHLENGTIAGSTTNMFEEFRNLLSFGIPFESAVRACSINPARAIGVADRCGSLKSGKSADIIFVDDNLELRHVMIKGRMLF